MDETHRFELGWSPDGVTIKVDDWECAAAGNGDAFDPVTKVFTLGNHPNHPSALHADAVFRNFRLWADGPGEQGPIVEIEGITPSPTTRTSGVVSLSGFARDQDEGGDRIVRHLWHSSRDGVLGTEESVLILASDLSAGLHTITFEAEDDEGSVSTTSAQVLVTEGEPGIYTIELPAREDAKIATGSKGDPNTNYGDSGDLMAGSGLPGDLDEASVLLFPLDELRGTVLAATLPPQEPEQRWDPTDLPGRTGSDERFALDGGPRSPGTPPPRRIGSPLDELPNVIDGEAYSFDVTDGVIEGLPLSLVITSEASDGGGHQSKEHPTAFEHPMLEVRFEVEELRVFSDGFEER